LVVLQVWVCDQSLISYVNKDECMLESPYRYWVMNDFK
jgi:hypothetical protein